MVSVLANISWDLAFLGDNQPLLSTAESVALFSGVCCGLILLVPLSLLFLFLQLSFSRMRCKEDRRFVQAIYRTQISYTSSVNFILTISSHLDAHSLRG